jgi:hypothetical protein
MMHLPATAEAIRHFPLRPRLANRSSTPKGFASLQVMVSMPRTWLWRTARDGDPRCIGEIHESFTNDRLMERVAALL